MGADLDGESRYTQHLWTVRATLAAATDTTFAANPVASPPADCGPASRGSETPRAVSEVEAGWAALGAW